MIKIKVIILASLFCLFSPLTTWGGETEAEKRFDEIEKNLAKGWNTWDVRSVLTHVYLPYGFAIELNMQDAKGQRKGHFLIGERGNNAAKLTPRYHTYDGTYSKLTVNWHGHEFDVETAAEETKEIILVTPTANNKQGGKLIVNPHEIWRRSINITSQQENFTFTPQDKSLAIKVKIIGKFEQLNKNQQVYSLDKPIAICCDDSLSISEAQAFVRQKGELFIQTKKQQFGKDYDCYNGMQTVLGWDTFYDPSIRKVISPVSRIWSSSWFSSSEYGGFTLFCWDTYFAAIMFSVDNKELAYANAGSITKAITETGFIPNCYYSNGFKSRDRSQPPVGSLAAWTIYNKYKEKWFLEYLYQELLSWNRWWAKHRDDNGLLCLGSSPYEKITYFHNEYDANTKYGSCLESGLDNSPMFDGVPFDPQKHLMEQYDVGINSLYIMDCKYLLKIAQVLGKTEDANELQGRIDKYSKNMAQLWNEEKGIFLNKSSRQEGKFNERMSPTNFYPLLAGIATKAQAKRMIREHLLNPKEFWGEYVIPSISRTDGAFKDNNYWRGRIWGPLNYLVYLGLRNYDVPKVRKDFAEKSKNLFLKSWLKDGYVFENYNATTGIGDDTQRSDKFYHWGALLGYISLLENKAIDF